MVLGYQVFPITKKSIVATVNNQAPFENRLVRSLADGNISFIYSDATLTFPVTAGQDYICDAGCTGVTSTANVLMS